jgi:hypothetical protein
MTFKPSPSAFAVAELAQGNCDFLHAGVAQVQRMGVALAAVADNRDLLVERFG